MKNLQVLVRCYDKVAQNSGFRRPPLTSPLVKGCRTPAGYRRVRRARSAGVGQASGEETAGRDGRGGAAGYGDLTAWPLALMAASSE